MNAVWSAFMVIGFWVGSIMQAMAMGVAPQVEHLRLGAFEGDVGALQWIAKEKGFFDKVGLNVDMKGFASGKAATDALLAGQVDVTTGSEFVFASLSVSEPQLRILGNISHYRNKGVVGRRDRGIRVPADLKGKRVGVTVPSGAEYSLHVFLAQHGMTMKDITPVHLSPNEIIESLAAGSIDTAITWQPHVQVAERRLGKNGVIFPGDSYDIFLLLITRQDTLVSQESALKKLLAGLLLAEEWVQSRPEEAKQFIATRFKLERAYVDNLWSNMRLTMNFPQELMTALDGEANWLMKYRGMAGGRIPNYAQYIAPGLLKAVRPAAVTVFSR